MKCKQDIYSHIASSPSLAHFKLLHLDSTKSTLMGIIKEFKEFTLKGNVVDLSVGIVIGVAFSAIVNSLVADIIMPLIGILLNGIDFKALMITAGSAKVTYGNFIQAVVNFLIIAFVLFLVIKGVNSMKKKEEAAPAAPPAPSNEEKLLMEIRDLLKK